MQSDHNDQSWKMPEAKILDDLINSNDKNSNSQILSKEKGNEEDESINEADNKCSRIHDFKDKNVESSEEETKDSNSPKNSHTTRILFLVSLFMMKLFFHQMILRILVLLLYLKNILKNTWMKTILLLIKQMQNYYRVI